MESWGEGERDGLWEGSRVLIWSLQKPPQALHPVTPFYLYGKPAVKSTVETSFLAHSGPDCAYSLFIYFMIKKVKKQGLPRGPVAKIPEDSPGQGHRFDPRPGELKPTCCAVWPKKESKENQKQNVHLW